jgi:4-amino-4-deoxy-L-arabinose transferase-like glycosyltransferase
MKQHVTHQNRYTGKLVLLGLTVCCLAILNQYDTPWIAWSFSIVIFVLLMSFFQPDANDQVEAGPGKSEIMLYGILILAGMIMRFYRLSDYPPFFSLETSRYAVALDEIMRGIHHFPRTTWLCECDESLLLYVTAPFSRIWGLDYLVLRTVSAVFTMGLIPAAYYLARKCFSKRAAWYAAVLTSCSGWLILSAHEYHRLRYEFSTALGMIAFGLLIGNQNRPVLRAGAAGILAALSLYFQISNILLISVVGLYLLGRFANRKQHALKILLIFGFISGSALFHSYSALHAVPRAEAAKLNHFIRSKTRIFPSYTSPEKSEHHLLKPPETANQPDNRFARLMTNGLQITSSFVWRDMEYYIGKRPMPLLPPVAGMLFLLGAAWQVRNRLKQPGSIPLITWIGCCGILAVIKPSVLRSYYLVTVLMMGLLIASKGLEALDQLSPDSRKWLKILIPTIMILLAGLTDITRSKQVIDDASPTPNVWMRLQMDLVEEGPLNLATLDLSPPGLGYLDQSLRYALLVADSSPILMKLVNGKLIDWKTDRPVLYYPSSSQTVSILFSSDTKRRLLGNMKTDEHLRIERLPRSKIWKLEFQGQLKPAGKREP